MQIRHGPYPVALLQVRSVQAWTPVSSSRYQQGARATSTLLKVWHALS